ncbi:tol-pal system YbgF family protein [Oleiphilus sp. HI0079]|uniref:tetratricopeptide repeat protein n=2 Tax=unclassified Oleiphilus TaxID=2631174 RepID=UPI0012E82F38|nr:hypothetical protein [Oleiphilus sp. HI0079]
MSLVVVPHVAANESFTVNFGEGVEAKKIGDLRPKVLALTKKPVPDVSIEYVMKRYRALFENASTPEVRIEALDRLNSLSASFGINEAKLTVDPYVQAEVILDTYQSIVDSGETYQRMDELLYQTAKATAFTGDVLESIKRLELLVGLYPKSPLVEEALFRLAENYFDLAEFSRAKEFYVKLLKSTKAPRLRAFSEYKLAWTHYRLEREGDALLSLSGLFDQYPGVYNSLFTTDLEIIPFKPNAYRGFDLPAEPGLLSDGMRLLALLNQNGDRIANIKSTAEKLGGANREPIVLRALVDQFGTKQRFFDAARLIEAYAEGATLDKALFNYSLRAVQLYAQGGHTIESWKAKANLVDRFGIRSEFWARSDAQTKNAIRDDLIVVVGELAHLNFVRMQESEVKDQRTVQQAKKAASYYLQLAALKPNTVESYEAMYLAAQALETSGQTAKAGELYATAAYSGLAHQYQAKSAYAAFYLASGRGVGGSDTAEEWSETRFELAQKYLSAFPGHDAAATTALATASAYVSSGNEESATRLFESYDAFTNAEPNQRLAAAISLAGLYYNGAEEYAGFYRAEQQYLAADQLARSIIKAQEIEGDSDVSKSQRIAVTESARRSIDDISNGIANSRFKLAELAETPEQSIEHYASIFDAFSQHPLAPDAAFNGASVAVQNKRWAQGAAMHQVFLEAFPSNKLTEISRQQLIVSLEMLGRTQEAADELMVQARLLVDKDRTLSANSAYSAAGYYAANDFPLLARESYEWLLRSHPERPELAVEALSFMVDQAEPGSAESRSASERLVSYVEENKLDDERSASLAAVNALRIASVERDAFNAMSISQPFKSSLKKKTAALNRCTEAYKRVVKFGIAEYTNAARFEMGDIYQGLAHAIMDSERPSGLSALEQEQYAILLEEQAIPIEEEAIALHEQNVKTRGNNRADEWISASYAALARLNPSLYARPIIGPSHAPVSY